jgi:CBS domain-containing protein
MTLSQGMRVEDVMSSPLETVSKDATIKEAAAAMREHNINALVVTTSPPSIITSTDVLAVAADGGDPAALCVADVMTTSVETVTPDLFLEEVAAMMTNFDINHLPVVDIDDEYVGMVSSTDITAQLS